MSKESTFIPLAFEWDRECSSYIKAFRLTKDDVKNAATIIHSAIKENNDVNPNDVILDAIRDGRLSGNFAACMISYGAQEWWESVKDGIYIMLGNPFNDEDD